MSLRELFERISKGYAPVDSAIRHAGVCDLLEALVEAVEPRPHTCGKCSLFRELHGCPSALRYSGRWYFVWPDEPACERFMALVEPEDTDATIRKLHKERDDLVRQLKERVGELRCRELAQAKAEIEKLHHWRDWWAEQLRLNPLDGRAPDIETHFAQLKADAEIGELVRGMRGHTRLVKAGVGYYAEAIDLDAGEWHSSLVGLHGPAEALRAIQKVEDV